MPADETPPLITFALIAYNQQDHVAAAVGAALAQDYQPLEIILSDDGSTDGTFAVMERAVSAYDGPHRVILRRSPRNRGLIGHINDVASLASGEIVVLAAGDDVSAPYRTGMIARVFRTRPETRAVFSGYATNRAVTPPADPDAFPPCREIAGFEIVYNGGGAGLGATYAYHRDCFGWPGPMDEAVRWEDRILPLRAALLGRVQRLDMELVRYHKLTDSVTANLAGAGFTSARETPDHWDHVIRHLRQARRSAAVPALRLLAFALLARSRRFAASGRGWPHRVVGRVNLLVRTMRRRAARTMVRYR